MERKRQDLLKAGASETTADDCIVANLLETLTSIPKDALFFEDWKFNAHHLEKRARGRCFVDLACAQITHGEKHNSIFPSTES